MHRPKGVLCHGLGLLGRQEVFDVLEVSLIHHELGRGQRVVLVLLMGQLFPSFEIFQILSKHIVGHTCFANHYLTDIGVLSLRKRRCHKLRDDALVGRQLRLVTVELVLGIRFLSVVNSAVALLVGVPVKVRFKLVSVQVG